MLSPMISARKIRDAGALVTNHRPDQIVNALRYAWHALLGYPVARLPYSPVKLALFVTQRCNLRCAYCQWHNPAIPHDAPRHPDMTLATLQRVLDMFPLAVSAVVAGAGEPMLHPDIFGILHVISEHHMQTALVTNGTLLPSKLESVLETPLDFMNISFYGVDAESFARQTGASAALFDEMLPAVAELTRRRRGCRGPRLLRGSFVCTKENMDEAVAFVALCERLGFDQAKLSNLTDYGMAGGGESVGLQEDDPAAQAFIARLKAMRHRIPVVLPRLVRRNYTSRRCDLPFKELAVGSNGSIAPCRAVRRSSGTPTPSGTDTHGMRRRWSPGAVRSLTRPSRCPTPVDGARS